ncbi:MAG: hypothetical protein N3E52_04865 [Candidatus Bathyarchaeota archaeon]|nr:hypothetical protein [Candidatus Bathyarchaeota archaeon]
MSGIISREIVSEIEVINAVGSKSALVVYQPGFSSFPRDASYAFAEGLALSGWRVGITTASSETPSELSNYSLLTLAYPVYGGTVGTAIVKYVNRINNFHGIKTVIIALQGGDKPSVTIDTLRQQVQAANGTFLKGVDTFYGRQRCNGKRPTSREEHHPLKGGKRNQ